MVKASGGASAPPVGEWDRSHHHEVNTRQRTKPVRVSLDLAPETHRALLQHAGDLAVELGRATVPHAEVLRALVDRLFADRGLRDEVARMLRTRYEMRETAES